MGEVDRRKKVERVRNDERRLLAKIVRQLRAARRTAVGVDPFGSGKAD